MGRALVFFAAFFAAIVVPQIVFHGLNYLYPPQAALVEDEEALRGSAAGFAHPALVLGSSVRPEFLRDARPVYPQMLQSAEVAQFGMTPSGASVLAARFATAEGATQARYALFQMLGKVGAKEDERGFFHFAWPQSGHAAIAGSSGRTFLMWVAPDAQGVEQLRTESRAFRAPERTVRTGLAGFVDDVRKGSPAHYAAIIFAYALLVSWLFLRMIGWATEVAPATAAMPVSAATLRERLLAVRFADTPISIGPGRSGNQLVVDWNYADAKWVDHARAHGMRKTHRLILQLDEATRTVRCREFHAESEWGAGVDGASIRWKASWEIVFYQYQHERVYGLQVGADGKLRASLSYRYTFDLREMKNPLIGSVIASGWRWRQVFFFSPRGLRWLHG